MLIYLLLTLANTKLYSPEEAHSLFQSFKQDYNKQYPSFQDEESAMKAFTDNLSLIDQLNEAHPDTQYAINQFADLTPQQFKSQILMPSQEPADLSHKQMFTNYLTELPEQFDWRTKNAVSKVKDQGHMGSCWGFSTVGNIEGQYFLKTGKMVDLSVEQLMECDATQDSKSNRSDCGIFGGWPYLAMDYVQKEGLSTEDTYPYCLWFEPKDRCKPCSPEGYDDKKCGPGLHPPMCKIESPCKKDAKKEVFIDGYISVSQDEKEIAQKLYQLGPMSVGLDASHLQHYKGGVFDPWLFKCGTKLNHAVLMVGYGTEKGKDFWTIKNSWGPKWGEDGFFRIKRGEGTCGINTNVITAVVKSDGQFLE